MKTLTEVREWTHNLFEKKGQRYDDAPYISHCDSVLEFARKYRKYVPDNLFEDIELACITHDNIEDLMTYNTLQEQIGLVAANIVYDVTNELGKNRKERAIKTYPKIRSNKWAIFVKLCDRLANSSMSTQTNHGMAEVYRREYPTFRGILLTGDFPDMWAELDEINGWDFHKKANSR